MLEAIASGLEKRTDRNAKEIDKVDAYLSFMLEIREKPEKTELAPLFTEITEKLNTTGLQKLRNSIWRAKNQANRNKGISKEELSARIDIYEAWRTWTMKKAELLEMDLKTNYEMVSNCLLENGADGAPDEPLIQNISEDGILSSSKSGPKDSPGTVRWLQASDRASLLPILADSQLMVLVKLKALKCNSALLLQEFPFELVIESYRGDQLALRDFFQFILNSMLTCKAGVEANLRPLIFLLVSFSMQHEKSSQLAELTQEAWDGVKDQTLVETMKELLRKRWPREHI